MDRPQLSLTPSKINRRSTSVDFIRITAFISVVSVHFFMNTEYYYVPLSGARLYFMTVMRTFFMVCVPLFIVLTGYLMSGKKLEKGYYGKILKTLFVYLCSCILCVAFKKYYLGQQISVSKAILGIFNYTDANYSWYIEMYIGLFLLIPFINKSYHGMQSKKQKLVLIGTMLALTALPGLFDLFIPNAESNTKILPSWWTNLYPLTYYFIGCYIKEFGIKINRLLNFILILISAFGFGTLGFVKSQGNFFVAGAWQDWRALPNVITTVLVFAFMLALPFEKLPRAIKKFAAVISDCCLGAYLLSYIFDQYFYAKLNAALPVVTDRIVWFVPIVTTVAVCSLAASWIINMIYKLLLFPSTLRKQNIPNNPA